METDDIRIIFQDISMSYVCRCIEQQECVEKVIQSLLQRRRILERTTYPCTDVTIATLPLHKYSRNCIKNAVRQLNQLDPASQWSIGYISRHGQCDVDCTVVKKRNVECPVTK